MSGTLYLIVLIATARSTVLAQPAAINTTLVPIDYQPKTIEGGNQVCPSSEERGATITTIYQEINSLIRNSVIICPGQDQDYPATSCLQIAQCNSDLPSGYYWTNATGSLIQLYCDMTRDGCDSNGGWTRVAWLNMSDPAQQCPTAWNEYPEPRSCGRMDTIHRGCSSVTYPVRGLEYSRVHGKVIGYPYGSNSAFYFSLRYDYYDIDREYLDGVSITHGSPRQHIWSFASGSYSTCCVAEVTCPCDNLYNINTPSWIGEDYFCEAPRRTSLTGFDADNPLWDGEGCEPSSTCCNNSGWFCKELLEPTSNDIEIRICGKQGSNPIGQQVDVPIQLLEIYVQ